MTDAAPADLPFIEMDRAGAGGPRGWWRYPVTVLVIVVLTALGSAAVVFAASLLIDTELLGALQAGTLRWQEAQRGDLVVLLAGLLLSVAVLLPVTLGAVAVIHERPPRTLITANPRFAWRHALTSFGVTLAALAVITAVQLALWPGDFALRWRPASFFLFLPVALALIPLQSFAEEVAFRGYVQQTVARASARLAVRLLVPAALFTAVHATNTEARAAGVWAFADWFILGLYMGWLAIRSNGLEYPAGFHAGVNLFLASVLGTADASLVTPTILVVVHIDYALNLAGTIVLCAAHYAIVVRLAAPPIPSPGRNL